MEKLEEGLSLLGIGPTKKQETQLRTYIEELEKWNPLYSLVNATGEDLIVRHILDSLSALPHLNALPGNSLADMGSGGGLPGIPLAIFMPSREVHLVERSGKRCDFLNNMKIILELDNIAVLNQDLKQIKGTYDLITFRAFRPFIPEIINGLLNALAPEGTIAAYKGKMSSIEEEKKQLKKHFNSLNTVRLKVPFLGEERHLLLLS
jgi:16S rRNA (guanine527-N7)-methyltransferase